MITAEQFKDNYSMEIGQYVETRGGSFRASYLSWAHATKFMKERHPSLHVAYTGHNMTDAGEAFVTVKIQCLETERETPEMFFPVMDNKFDAAKNPTVTDINYAVQRATAKIIAVVTGIGLPLYAGEDIPTETKRGCECTTEQAINRTSETSWQGVVVPFGKNKGKALGDLTPKSLAWYVENYEANDYEDSKQFRAALDAAKKDLGMSFDEPPINTGCNEDIEPNNEVTDQVASDATDPDLDEEVLF